MVKNLVSLSFSVIMLLACSLAGSAVVTPTATLTPPAAATLTPPPAAAATQTPPPSDTPPPTPSPTDTPLPTPSPTDTPTPTPSQPVFNLDALGDNRKLASFIMTFMDTDTGSGIVDKSQRTIEYIKQPFGASESTEYNGFKSIAYWIGGVEYENQGRGHWTIHLAPDPALLQNSADMRQNAGIYYLKSARFAGQEDFKGIPSNHFAFDQSDIIKYDDTEPGAKKIAKAQGDFYLAQDGNYVLYFHAKLTGNVVHSVDGFVSGVEEITKELTSINQLKEIALPADYPALELDLGFPLPADTKLESLDHYKTQQEGGDIYNYRTSVSNDEFLLFYRNLAPTNGWSVSQAGPIPELGYCSQGCATLNKGKAQIILYREVSPFDGTVVIVGYYHK